MNYNEKREFLEHAKELAMNLEEKTDKFIEIKIGWIREFRYLGMYMPVTIMLNHENRWFGNYDKLGWNEQVIFDNIEEFIPVKENYLALNELIEKVYKK